MIHIRRICTYIEVLRCLTQNMTMFTEVIHHFETVGRSAADWLQDHRQLTAAGVAVLGTGVAYHLGSKLYARHILTQARLKKIKERQDSIEKWTIHVKNDSISQELQKEIICLSVPVLTARIKDKKYSVKQVLRAYQQQAIYAHQRTNCIVEPIWEAEDWANNLDHRAEKNGLLFGVPVSVKDNYGIKGYDSTIGCSKFIGQPISEDSVTVEIYKREGAVPFVKTTVPQTMMSLETTSPIFGQTVNPFDPTRVSGGSSGGESALIALRGSPLGIASDIGGSIRYPCHCTGIMGLKTTGKRTSNKGTRSAAKGQNIVRPGYGPMAYDLDSLVIGVKVMFHPGVFDLDYSIPPVPFSDNLYEEKRKLRIGYYKEDGYFSCTPACQRAVEVAKKALESIGHELVVFDMSVYSERAMNYYIRAVAADNGKALLSCIENDAIDHSVAGQINFYKFGKKTKTIIAWIARLLGMKKFSSFVLETIACDLETTSPIFGQTVNPFDPTRVSGGSSGGESALIALRGSPLGIASDIGGSIRYPCHCTGIMGLKTTGKRTSNKGTRSAAKGQNIVRPGYGPMAYDLDSLVIGVKVMFHPGVFDLDYSIPPVPFSDNLYEEKRKLRIGYYKEDGYFSCTPACQRAVEVAKKALESIGHELVVFDMSVYSERAMNYYIRAVAADNGKALLSCIENDAIDHSVAGQINFYKFGKKTKTIIAWIARLLGMKKFSSFVLETIACESVFDWQTLVKEVDEFKDEISSAVHSLRLDAILGPAFPAPALTIGTWAKVSGCGSYTFIYNVVDFPTGSMKVTEVTEADEAAMGDFPVPDFWHKAIKKSSEKGTVGLPLNVTIAALPWRDEMCLRVMADLHSALTH